MENTSTLGLRDKKRAETRARLERAAVELVLRDGLTQATIDAISEAADVSPRTFFNYFDSKEDAILGLHDVDLSDDAIAAKLSDGHDDIVSAIIHLLFWVAGPTLTASELHVSRMQVVKAHPELLTRHFAHMSRVSEQITTGIQSTLRTHPGFVGDADAELTVSADILLAICTGAMRVVVKQWITSPSIPEDQLESRAVELVREVTKKIQ